MNSIQLTSTELTPEFKQEMLDRFLKRLKEMALSAEKEKASLPNELNPDVIVISSDQTMIFEAQNERASTVLRQKCGWDTETISVRERVNVHPAHSQTLIRELSEAGLMVT